MPATTTLQRKPDWERVRQRYEAWWTGQLREQPLLKVTAPLPDRPAVPLPPADPDQLLRYFTDPDEVVPRQLAEVDGAYYAGDSFPAIFPVAGRLVAIQAAYHGSPYYVMPVANSAWADPAIGSWEDRAPVEYDPDNWWWQISQALLARGAEAAVGRAVVGIPDLQGDGQIAALLRGTAELAIDCLERPDDVARLVEEVNVAWLRYYRECNDLIQPHGPGYVDNLGVYSDRPMVTLECDFSCLVSTDMFDRIFLPGIARQASWVERTIYHLDGPGAIRHLDSLLALEDLDGIQWQPGAAGGSMLNWVDLLRRVQDGGKRLVVGCAAGEVKGLLSRLSPAGLLITTGCASPDEADALVASVGLA